MKICTHCAQLAHNSQAGNIAPPMCAQHLDLAVLATLLTERNEAVTIEALAALIDRAPQPLSLTAADVPTYFVSDLTYRIEAVL